MPTVIDALIVTLGLDAGGFKKGQEETAAALKKTKENATKHTKEMEVGAKSVAAAFQKVSVAVLGLMGVSASISGFKQFVERMTASDAAAGRLAANMSIATKELSAWQGMAAKFGGSAEDIDSAFRNTFKIAQELRMGGSSALGPLGMLLKDDLGAFTQMALASDVQGMMKLLQRTVAGASDRGQALHMLQQAGYSDTTFTMMREVGSQLERQLELQRQLNVATERDVELAKQRQAAWSRFADALERIGRLLVNSPLFSLVDRLNVLTDKLKRWADNPVTLGDDAVNSLGGLDGWLARTAWKWLRPGGSPGAAPGAPSAPATPLPDGAYKKESTLRSIMGIGPKWYGAEDARDAQPSNIAELQAELRRPQGPAQRAALQAELARLTSIRAPAASAPGAGTQITIDKIEVHTQATDAQGIARGLRDALRKEQHLFSSHGNVGQR